MKIPSKKQIDKNEELIRLLNHTEREWEAFKQRKPRNNRRSSTRFLEHSIEHLLEHSPRHLMCSLQRPSGGVRNLDSAVEEVSEERRDGIRSGRIRGRRLFAEAVELDLDYEDHGGGGGDLLSGEWDLADTISVSCLSEESLSEEKEVVVEEKVAEEKGCLDGGCGGGGCRVAMPWLVFLLVLIIFGIISMSCYGKHVRGHELLLVAT